MTLCAIYARVSDESQLKGDSIEHQISYCKEHARRRSMDDGAQWVTPESFVYVDEGITGTSMVMRPAVQRLIRDARMRKFEVVLFKGISRFARDTVDALFMLRTLTACGVRVVSMEENFDSRRDSAEFIFTIHSALAQAESEKTAIRVRVGATQKAKSGKWNGQPPDGYVLNPYTKRLEIDETTAPIIRDIFSMYQIGLGCRKIADVLNEQGRYTKRGNFWTQRNISRLLRNPVYAGDVVYGRREKQLAFPDASDPLARRKRAVWVNDPERMVVCKDAHASIVPREMFEKVRLIMDKRRPTSGPTEYSYVLTKGLLVCTCGSSMTITYNRTGTAYYRCIRQKDSGRSTCASGYVRALDLEREVLASVRADVLDALRFDELVIPLRPMEGFQQQLQVVQVNIDKQIDKSQALFDHYTEGRLLEEQYARMSKTIETRIQTLQKTRDVLRKALNVEEQHVDAEQLIRQALRDFLHVETWNARLTREILALFLENVSVLRSGDGCKEVRIKYRFFKSSDAVVQ